MKIRRELLVTDYDFWLDYYGTPGRQRRELRRELRANLDESTAERGWEAARDGLGSVRVLARASADSVRELELQPGSLAVAVVKSTNVIIETPEVAK